jgi:HK97 family phage portal protein
MGLFSWNKRNSEIVQPEEKVEKEERLDYNSAIGLYSRIYDLIISPQNISGAFSAIELISNSIAQLPIHVRNMNDGNKVIENHYVNNLLACSMITKFIMIKQVVTDMLLYGNGYIYIKRTNSGKPSELIYCPNKDVTIQYNKESRILYYIIPNITKSKIEPCDIIHIYKNTENGVEGKGVKIYAHDALSLASSANNAAKEYFGSGCHVSGILSTDSPRLNKQARENIKQAWNESHGNGKNGIAVLENGMKYQSVSSNSRDAQLLESRQYQLNEIARFFNISPILLGDLSKGSYSSIEAAQWELVMHTLMPYIVMMQEEFNRKLLLPNDRKHCFIDFDETFLIKADKQATADYYTKLVSRGILTINEAREALGYGAVDGGDDNIIPYTNINDNKLAAKQSDNDKNIDTEDGRD